MRLRRTLADSAARPASVIQSLLSAARREPATPTPPTIHHRRHSLPSPCSTHPSNTQCTPHRQQTASSAMGGQPPCPPPSSCRSPSLWSLIRANNKNTYTQRNECTSSPTTACTPPPRTRNPNSSALTLKPKPSQLAVGPCCVCQHRHFVVAHGFACTQRTMPICHLILYRCVPLRHRRTSKVHFPQRCARPQQLRPWCSALHGHAAV